MENQQRQKKQTNETIICLPYDIENIYAFYCSRYENVRFKDFLKLGYDEFRMKLNSIPESEPLHLIFKSRAINIAKIKDKEEKKYWRELKRANKIPDIYLSQEEINLRIKEEIKDGGIKNAR